MGRTGIYNIISLVFLVLSLLVVVFVIARMGTPPIERESSVLVVPTAVILPSQTPSNTPTLTPRPTETLTPTNTLIPTNTETPTPTTTVSPTITETLAPTETPTITLTPSETSVPPTETPSGPTSTPEPTLSPFLYDLRNGQVIFTQNFANTAGCAWQGLGGQVFDINGLPLNGLRIHVFNNQFDQFVDSGSNSLYGAGGWEVPVGSVISTNIYFVELLSPGGTVISPRVQVGFPSDCLKNLALVNFEQKRAQ